MEDLQDRIDNLDEAEFGDEWKDNRRREIEELLRRGKSKKKDIQESITDEEREFLDSYHEAEGEFKDELKAENKERDSGDKMDKEERAELLAEKLDEWLDEHIDNEAGERSSEAAETLQAEMDRLQQIRDNPKRPPTDTQFRLSEEFEADKTYDEAKAAVEKAETDAVFSAKGEKAMADHIDQAVKSGKVSKDIGDGLTQVIKKYGKNLKHVSLAFSDDLPAGVKGAFKPAKDTIMLSAERMTHEGIAAGLEELFHGMEKVVSPEARIEIKKAYEKEMAQEIKGLQEALAWARKNNRTDMASDIQGTLTWLAKAAKGQAEGLPPIRDYYKFSDASEYFADRMMNYEWDRLSGFTHPDDSSLVGRASKWFRGLANEITDTFEAKWGEDRLKREWLKLGRMEQRVQGDNKSLAQAVWFDDQSQTRKWADDFLLRPGDGLFSVKQQSLAPDVEAAMLRTTPQLCQA